MPRPCKQRRVRGYPISSYFKPNGIPKRDLEEIILTNEEFEAIRLKDYEDLEQIECAKQMEISQTTFHRIITIARKKVSDAIINGKAIKIN
ncbi:MAG: DUF134 domain-containing protein [Candidatus Nanoarchaeia archaeon]|nr:DUF134 domain-containing protein [Candidatus Nanoarchaeia archaeon]